MKKILLAFFIVFLNLGFIQLIEAKDKSQTTSSKKDSDCEAKWAKAKKNDRGDGKYNVGGMIGEMYISKDEWIARCKGPSSKTTW